MYHVSTHVRFLHIICSACMCVYIYIYTCVLACYQRNRYIEIVIDITWVQYICNHDDQSDIYIYTSPVSSSDG